MADSPVRVVHAAELKAAERERSRIIDGQAKHQRNKQRKPPEGRYETWCYCSWCPWSALSVPHYRRRGDCPRPDSYRTVSRGNC